MNAYEALALSKSCVGKINFLGIYDDIQKKIHEQASLGYRACYFDVSGLGVKELEGAISMLVREGFTWNPAEDFDLSLNHCHEKGKMLISWNK